MTESAIKKWLEEGSIDLTVTRVNMLGAPGAGKTCSLHLLLNEDPPTTVSTPAVSATRVAVCDKTIWNRVTRADLLDILAADFNANQEMLSEMKTIEKDKQYHTEAVIQEILATQPKGIQKLSDHWLYVIDSGGQPAYQELLPLFTRAASLNIITLDLSKPFNERFDLMYRINGQYFPCHSKSSQLAFFQSAVSTGASFKPLDIFCISKKPTHSMHLPLDISCISKKPTHSMHLVLGTHYDKVSDATLKEKEEILKSSMSSLESYLQNCVIHQSDDDSIIFPINTIAASEERAKYSEEICKAIWYFGSDASLKIRIPIRWFVFELSLPEQSILSIKEALSIGERYGMNKEDTKQALRYFHDVSLMLYYPEVTNVVFIDSKPILKILSQLIALTYVDDRNAQALILINPIPYTVINNLKEGFFNEDIFGHLKSKSEVFLHPQFQLSDLIRLLLHLNIITKLEDEPKGHYFIPYALPSYNEPVSVKETDAKPLLIVWREEESEEILPVPTGLFPLTITHLLNQKGNVTEIPPSTSEYCKFRDAMSLKITITSKHTLHLINRYTHIEVYFTGPTQHCPLVRKLLTTAIDNSSDAMHLKHNYVNGFACPYNESCYCIVNEDHHEVADCTVCGESPALSNDYWYWFDDLKDILNKEPKLKDLHRLFDSSAAHYSTIGTALDVDVTDLLHSPLSASDKLIIVFQRWMDSNRGVTWRKVLQVCDDYPEEFGKIKTNVEEFLSSDEAFNNGISTTGTEFDEVDSESTVANDIRIKRKIKKWLKEGIVDLKITRINMHGLPGAGKTCSKRLLLNEPPPTRDSWTWYEALRKMLEYLSFRHNRITSTDSTPVACPAVKATRITVDRENKKWKKVGKEELFKQLASTEVDEPQKAGDDASKSTHLDEPSSEEPAKSGSTKNGSVENEPVENEPTENGLAESGPPENEPAKNGSAENEPAKNEPAAENGPAKNEPAVENRHAKNELATENGPAKNESAEKGQKENKLSNYMKELKKIVDNNDSEKLSTNWVYFIDSGGQPAYRELLPLFTRAATLNIITIDLTKPLDEKCEFQYRISQHEFPINKKLQYSNHDIIQSTISSEAMLNLVEFSHVYHMPKHPHYLILGTRLDDESVTEERLKEMNESLIKCLDLTNVIWNKPRESIIFPVNTLLPHKSDKREEASVKLCTAISNCEAEMIIKLPIRLFFFEIELQLEAEKKTQSFLTKEEVIEIGKSLELDTEDINDALQYLHNVTIILYYHDVDVLSNLVFVDPEPILNVLSCLIAITYVDHDKLHLIANPPPSQDDRNNLIDFGLFKESLLNDIGKHIFNKDFTSSHMITLLKHLNIIAEVENKDDHHGIITEDVENKKEKVHVVTDGENEEKKNEFFFPCALQFCNKFNDPPTEIQPLLIGWEIKNKGTTTLERTTTLAIPQGLFPLTIMS
ncbi:PREDICTED: uncharacterized protein LOC109588947 [Amphimedon queenslandica]|uniref:COR domain-containing protein n=1 Tax=Amphimedon queenslandica TaxID=400682 RepID=A0AAN0JU77_AMPQE|nr:PREDICTED: uncharacterized protein LOC109588947 [Amphimedon queenslandica]|eukprot:XP_019860610.1 PREDICTED: uncharacterized protein LOC109588947 [Amphimedon queenslandica]